MGVDKVILRACLSTLAAVAALLLFMFVALCAFFPSTMMVVAYDMGMEGTSVRFAERAYKNNGDVYYIAYATEVAIEDKARGKIVSCGEKLIKDEEFAVYCEQKGEEYERLIYRQVCVSKYEQGDGEGAVQLAYDSLKGGFAEDNALVAVLMKAISRTDLTVVAWGVEKMEGLQVQGTDATRLSEVLGVCKATLQEYGLNG